MKNSILWINPSITCLGDRLLDTMLLSTYAKFFDANLYFDWKDCPFTIGQENPTYAYKEGVNKEWDKVRFEDYRFENYTQYFNLPKNIKINEQIDSPNYFFTDTLGGVISPFLFYQRYLHNICTYEEFDKSFEETMSEFKPTDKLINLVSNKLSPNISVHLRRTDKINKHGDYSTFMTYDGLDLLNDKTKDAISIFNNKDKLFYFSSDDVEERNKYHLLYPNHIEHDFDCLAIEKTYIDLYMLSKSEYIILSQIHSNFSVFASYINKSKLVYLYDNSLIVTNNFNKSNNFIYYMDLIK